jgi:myosin-1
MGNERILTPEGAAACRSRRNALLMELYESVFEWIIARMNSRLSPPRKGLWVGLLDIFGFEVFENNSLEQLCINYAN